MDKNITADTSKERSHPCAILTFAKSSLTVLCSIVHFCSFFISLNIYLLDKLYNLQYNTIQYNTIQYNTIQRVYKLGYGMKPVGLIQIRFTRKSVSQFFIEPCHEKFYFTFKAHQRGLIWTFGIICSNSTMCLLSISEISESLLSRPVCLITGHTTRGVFVMTWLTSQSSFQHYV